MFLENELPKGWVLLSEKESRAMEVELAREVCDQHILFGKQVNAVARAVDRDDFLFTAKANDDNLYLVHLTWKQEIDPDWPTVDIFRYKDVFLREFNTKS
jgi:hypothetical protein